MSLLVALPVVLPLAAAVALLAIARWGPLQKAVALACNGAVVVLASFLLLRVRGGGVETHLLSGWPPPYGIILVADLLAATLVTTTAGLFLASLVYSLGYVRPTPLATSYLPLYFFLMAGVNGAFLTGDLFNLFVFIEVMLLATYGLVITPDPEGIIPRGEKLEAVFKYLVLNLIGAALMLLAVGTLYGTTGTLNMADLSVKVRELRAQGVVHLDFIALLLVAVFGLKAAAVPFHFWLPDVHPSAPAPISALLSGILIKVGAYALIRLTTLLFPGFEALSEAIVVLGIATLLLGGLLATGQVDVKRLLAYSSISQMGFLLVGVGIGGARGIAAALFFLVNHAIIKGMLFLAAGNVMHLTHERTTDRMGGLASSSPALAASFLVGAMALAGLPPTNGFVSKLLVFQVLLESGNIPYLALVFAGALLSVLYALRAWIDIFWGRRAELRAKSVPASSSLPVGIMAGLCILLGLLAEPLMGLVSQVGVEVSDPSHYVDAIRREGLP